MGLTDRVLETIRRRGLLRGGETVVVAVSGGADSVALLHALQALQPALRLVLHVGHVHHGLRPDADRDADLVAQLAQRLDLPFHLERVAVRRLEPARGEEGWSGVEAEARRARYQAFRRLLAVAGAERLATGHTADDQAETVLMRLLQGAGPRGLAGIPPRRGHLIRPLIDLRRAEVQAFCRERGAAWVDDPMNRERRFLRTRIRHELIPYLEVHFEPQLVPLLGRSADLTRQVVADLDRRAGEILDASARHTSAGLILPVAALAGVSRELAAETVRLAAMRAGAPAALRAASYRAIARAVDPAATTSRARLGRVALERSGRWLRIGPRRLPALDEHAWSVPGCLDLAAIGVRLEARVFPRPPGYTPPAGPWRAAFDADAMPRALVVRGRRPGDRFPPFGGPGRRRLKSFLADEGVPRWERDRVPLVDAGGEIAWVVGVRRGRMAPVTPDTSRILEMTAHGPVAVVTGSE